MNGIVRAFALVALTSLPLLAEAQVPISVWGSGGFSCGDWLEDTKREVSRIQYTEWMLGFLTSFNYYNRNNQVRPPDRASVSAWIDKYCRDNPLHQQFMAAAALVEELGGPKAPHPWKR